MEKENKERLRDRMEKKERRRRRGLHCTAVGGPARMKPWVDLLSDSSIATQSQAAKDLTF